MALKLQRAYRYVVLGGGNSAGYAARQFVLNGVSPGEVAIVSSEGVAPYERPALSKAFLHPKEKSPPRLPGFNTCVGAGQERQPLDWYSKHGIDLILDTRIDSVDTEQKTLESYGSKLKIRYDKLLVATGCHAIKLQDFGVDGSELKNIFTLRDNADGLKLYEAIESIGKEGGDVVIVGGGYMGMECAAALAVWKEEGYKINSITVVYPEEHLLARLFTPEIAAYYEKVFRGKGVEFVKNSRVVSFKSDGNKKVSSVNLGDGRVLNANLVIAGVGARANTDMFKGRIDQANGGIQVDQYLRSTSHPNSIFAVGDVCTFPSSRVTPPRLIRVEHVGHARKSAEFAVNVAMGKNHKLTAKANTNYDYLPFFYSRFFKLSWKFFGENPIGSETLIVGNMSPQLACFWRFRNKIVGTFLESGTPAMDEKILHVANNKVECSDEKWDQLKNTENVDDAINILVGGKQLNKL